LGYRIEESKLCGNSFGQQLWGAAFGSRFAEWLWGAVLANRFAESQLWGNSFGEQLWGTALGSICVFGEQLWTAFWTSFEAASGNSSVAGKNNSFGE